MTADRVILAARNLKVWRNGRFVLTVPALEILRGEIVAVLGPNGAGKSSLLLALAGLLKPGQGEIYFQGRGIGSAEDLLHYRRAVTMVFQKPLLFKGTVFKNVAVGLKLRRTGRKEIENKVIEALKLFDILSIQKRPSSQISGGEAQRVCLARAFALNPEIILLDEPFSSLDQPTRNSLIDDLERILRGKKMTAVFTTHERTEALRLADRIAILDQGQIVQLGPSEEIMNRPANELVASLIGMETMLAGPVIRAEGGTFTFLVAGREIEAVGEVKPGEWAVCCLRPDQVTLWEVRKEAKTSARNFFPGQVTKIIPLGPYFRVVLDCGFPLVAYITQHSQRDLELCPGKEVFASFKATSLYLIRREEKRAG